jgi:hypothetical protein
MTKRKSRQMQEIERLRDENLQLVQEKYRLEELLRDMREAERAAANRRSFGSPMRGTH